MEFPPFSPGADTWIVAETESLFFRRLDWLCNFSLSKAIEFHPQKLSQTLRATVTACEMNIPLDSPRLAHSTECLIVGATPFVPTNWILYLQLADLSPSQWSSAVSQQLRKLGAKNGRLFYSKKRFPKFEGEAEFPGLDVQLVHLEDYPKWI